MDNAEYSIRHGHDSEAFRMAQERAAAAADRRRQAARGSKTLLQVGKQMIANGRTSSDLEMNDLLEMNPFDLPPMMRAKVMAMRKKNPIYQKESQKLGAYPPSELEKPDKFLPKTQQFTKWHGGKYFANSTLNTSTDKSKVHRTLDQFGSI